MKVKTSELEGGALDWAVAMAAYPLSYVSGDRLRVRAVFDGEEETIASVFLSNPRGMMPEFKPSTDWSQGGPLLDSHMRSGFEITPTSWKEGFCCSNHTDEGLPHQGWESKEIREYGSSPLIAVCRAIVAAKLGDTVDIPDDLL